LAEALISEGDAQAEADADAESVIGLATVLQKIGREAGLTADDIAIFDEVRDHSPARAVRFD
jgi:hypothetical protein